MNRRDVASLAFVLAVLASVFPAISRAQDLTVSGADTISTPSTYDNVTITSTGVLTLRAPLAVNLQMTVQSGGKVTHAARDTAGLVLNVGGTLTVQAGGWIDVSGMGLKGGRNGSTFGPSGSYGEAFDATGAIVPGAAPGGPGAGGGYGGTGGTSSAGAVSNPAYGSLEDPRKVGAGGGSGEGYGGGPAGNGGGRIRITAGSCVIDGSVLANGGGAPGWLGGGGSGGAIRLDVGSLSGAGVIQATGAVGRADFSVIPGQLSGAGGGGRIAIYYASMSLPVANVQAQGGATTTDARGITTQGAAGTIYLRQSGHDGDLIVDDGGLVTTQKTALLTGLATLQSLTLSNRGQLTVASADVAALTVEQAIPLTGTSALTLGSGVTLTVSNASGFDLNVQSGSTLTLNAGATLNANAVRVNGATLNTNVDLSFPVATDLELSGNGTLNVLNGRTLSLGALDGTNLQSGTLNVPTGSRLDVATNSVTIASGVTLIKDGSFVASDQIGTLTVASGGKVTHAARDTAGLVLNVGGTLTVQAGGWIDVSGMGLKGGRNGSTFGPSGSYGEAFDATGAIVPGAAPGGPGAGGAYGGTGGTSSAGAVSNPAYGSLEDPRQVGAGGGSGEGYGGGPAGNGGGRIRITAGSCVIDGSVLANGGGAPGWLGGGGSGGAIRLDVGSLSGAGVIQATGAVGRADFSVIPGQLSGAGGGGRIAIYYASMSLPVANVQAQGASMTTDPRGTAAHSAAGTVYLQQVGHDGDLIVNDGNIVSSQVTPLRTGLVTLQSLTLSNHGQLSVAGADVAALTVEQAIPLTGTSALTLGSGVTLTVSNASGFDLNVQSGSTLTLNAGATLNANAVRVNGATLNTNVDLSFPVATDLELSGNGTLNVLNGRTLSLGALDGTNLQSGTLNVPTGSRLDVATNSVTIASGVTLIKDGSFVTSDQIGTLTVQSGGKVTHAARDTAGLVLSVGGTLTVQAGGWIDVSGMGLKGGRNGSTFGPSGSYGEAFDATGAIVPGAAPGGPGAGGAYGGTGGTSSAGAVSNPAYGSLEDPRQVGAGGGSGEGYGGGPAGNGGGRIRITAGSCVIDGSVLANGGPTPGWLGGGGSGGAIRLDVGSLSGAGVIQATGAAGRADFSVIPGQLSGAGGGGRIAIYYASMSLPVANVQAQGGATTTDARGITTQGAAGTIYLRQSGHDGDLIVDDGGLVTTQQTLLRSGSPVLQSVVVQNRGQLVVDNGATLTVSNASGFDLNVQSGSALTLSAGATLNARTMRVNGATLNTNIDLSFPVATELELSGNGTLNVLSNRTLSLGALDGTNLQSGTLNVPTGSRLDVATNSVTIASGVTLIKGGTFGTADQIRAVTVEAGGVLTCTAGSEYGLRLNVADSVWVYSGGLVDAGGKGLAGGFTPENSSRDGLTYDSDDNIVAGATSTPGNLNGAGGSYGGLGGISQDGGAPPLPYGSAGFPRHLGSGGAGGGHSTPGGNGGGRITIESALVHIDGQISADGAPGLAQGNSSPGGGSGGSVEIYAPHLEGAGSVTARGGPSACVSLCGGAGGGGRIAVYSQHNDMPASAFSSAGGVGGMPGGSGSVWSTGSTANLFLEPSLIGNDGTVTIALSGLPLSGLQSMTLRASGLPDIVSTAIDTLSNNTRSAQFTLTNAPLGQRDVQLVFTGGRILNYTAVLTLAPATHGTVTTTLFAPNTYRFNTPTTLLTAYTNTGNVNSDDVTLTLDGIPARASILQPDKRRYSYEDSLAVRWPIVDSLPPGLVHDGVQRLWRMDAALRPGETRYWRVIVTDPGPTLGAHAARADSGPPPGGMLCADVTPDPCLHQLCDKLLCDAFVGCLSLLVAPFKCWDNLGSAICDWGTNPCDGSRPCDDLTSCANYVMQSGAECLIGVIAPPAGFIMSLRACLDGTKAVRENCANPPPKPPKKCDAFVGGGARDPNEILGPPGYAAQQFIAATAPLVYQIHFENVSSASAAAAQVKVAVPIDTAGISKTTSAVTAIGVGNVTIPILASSGLEFFAEGPAPKDPTLHVRVNGVLNSTRDTLVIAFATIDATTNAPPTDPLAGFLPPNIAAPEGEGYVVLRLERRGTLETGRQRSQSALITFDQNPEMATNVWATTDDADAPSTAVAGLPEKMLSASIPLTVHATDLGAGVDTCVVFGAINGGPYAELFRVARDTTIVYTATIAGNYAFYSVGVDAVGNSEAAPTVPDATTYVDASVPAEVSLASVERSAEAVKIIWAVALTGVHAITVERRGANELRYAVVGSWPIVDERVTIEDKTASPTDAYYYRLRWQSGPSQYVSSDVEVKALAALQLGMRVTGTTANGSLLMNVVLPSDEPALVTVYDVMGRAAAARRIQGRGVKDISVGAEGGGLASGVWFVVLRQGAGVVKGRAVVIR